MGTSKRTRRRISAGALMNEMETLQFEIGKEATRALFWGENDPVEKAPVRRMAILERADSAASRRARTAPGHSSDLAERTDLPWSA